MKRTLAIFALLLSLSVPAAAQTTAFNFQGRLNDGSSPANGRYDLQFKLYDAIAGGTQVGATVGKPNLMLVNGVFSTTLDFGTAAFSGGDRFLEIQLRPNGSSNAFVILGARQQMLSVPYAAKSLNASNADNAANAQNLGGIAPTGFILNRTASQTADFNVSGSGTMGGRLSVGGDGIINGNVGIGGANSGYKLYVDGNVRMTGNTTHDGSSLTIGNSIVNGNSDVGGNLKLLGNTTQPLASSGLPKAMLKINTNGTIAKCYNGITGAATGNCGFTVDHFTTGGYGITFGFGTDLSIVSLAVEYDRTNSEFVAANYSTSAFFGHLDVYTFRFPNALPTAPYDRPFTIILY